MIHCASMIGQFPGFPTQNNLKSEANLKLNSRPPFYPIQNVYLQNAWKGKTRAGGNSKCW